MGGRGPGGVYSLSPLGSATAAAVHSSSSAGRAAAVAASVGQLGPTLVPRGATLDLHTSRARINLSNKDLLPDRAPSQLQRPQQQQQASAPVDVELATREGQNEASLGAQNRSEKRAPEHSAGHIHQGNLSSREASNKLPGEDGKKELEQESSMSLLACSDCGKAPDSPGRSRKPKGAQRRHLYSCTRASCSRGRIMASARCRRQQCSGSNRTRDDCCRRVGERRQSGSSSASQTSSRSSREGQFRLEDERDNNNRNTFEDSACGKEARVGQAKPAEVEAGAGLELVETDNSGSGLLEGNNSSDTDELLVSTPSRVGSEKERKARQLEDDSWREMEKQSKRPHCSEAPDNEFPTKQELKLQPKLGLGQEQHPALALVQNLAQTQTQTQTQTKADERPRLRQREKEKEKSGREECSLCSGSAERSHERKDSSDRSTVL